MTDFKYSPSGKTIEQAAFTWQSPSNIALVKYWGKKGKQIPANPSISFTLNNCYTQTSVEFEHCGGAKPERTFFFEGKQADSFGGKAFSFLENILDYQPFLREYHLTINTENSFPHSSGIASSASGMSALALCCMSLEKELDPTMSDDYFFKKASFLARIGSGSAARSVYGGIVSWGEHEHYPGSSDLYATPYQESIHEEFLTFRDIVLLVDEGEKKVSSTVGHGLLNGHPFAAARYDVAQENMTVIKEILKTGDIERFGELVEREALMLHALMMSGTPPFILMKSNTLAIIESIQEFRKQSGVQLYFTLDAGANVHLLFPKRYEQTVVDFVNEALIGFCQNNKYICDQVGNGPQALNHD